MHYSLKLRIEVARENIPSLRRVTITEPLFVVAYKRKDECRVWNAMTPENLTLIRSDLRNGYMPVFIVDGDGGVHRYSNKRLKRLYLAARGPLS